MVYRYATARNLLGGRGAGTKCCVAQPKRIQVKPLTLTSALRKSPSWVSGYRKGFSKNLPKSNEVFSTALDFPLIAFRWQTLPSFNWTYPPWNKKTVHQLKNGWLECDRFLLGPVTYFQGKRAVTFPFGIGEFFPTLCLGFFHKQNGKINIWCVQKSGKFTHQLRLVVDPCLSMLIPSFWQSKKASHRSFLSIPQYWISWGGLKTSQQPVFTCFSEFAVSCVLCLDVKCLIKSKKKQIKK